MFTKSAFRCFLGVILIAFLFSPVFAQIADVCKFKGINIPFDLKHNDSIIQKGKYDLELLKHTAQTAFYLRFKKRGKQQTLVLGEQLSYSSSEEKEIPKKPQLKMKKNSQEKTLQIIVESGTATWKYPAVKVRFILKYEE